MLGVDSVAKRTMLDEDSRRKATNMIGFFPSALPPFRFLEEGVDEEVVDDERERMGMGMVVGSIEEDETLMDGGDVTVRELSPYGGAD